MNGLDCTHILKWQRERREVNARNAIAQAYMDELDEAEYRRTETICSCVVGAVILTLLIVLF